MIEKGDRLTREASRECLRGWKAWRKCKALLLRSSRAARSVMGADFVSADEGLRRTSKPSLCISPWLAFSSASPCSIERYSVISESTTSSLTSVQSQLSNGSGQPEAHIFFPSMLRSGRGSNDCPHPPRTGSTRSEGDGGEVGYREAVEGRLVGFCMRAHLNVQTLRHNAF